MRRETLEVVFVLGAIAAALVWALVLLGPLL
jgi:hypothetical protein